MPSSVRTQFELATVLLVVGSKERLSVAGAAAIIDAKHHIATSREVLRQRVVAAAGLAAGSAVHEDHRRCLPNRAGLMRFPEDIGNGYPVPGLEPNDLGVDEVRRIDLRVQRLRKPGQFAGADFQHV
jgi:hypothetical protein